MKLKRLFNGKSNDSKTEISGSFGGNDSDELLLGNASPKKHRDAWSFSIPSPGADDRGRAGKRPSLRRSSSERPATRRSKSEVGKRLKNLEVDFGTKSKKKGSSKSAGGTFKGKSSDVRAKIDKLALERSDSDPKISTFDSLFDQSNSERYERTTTKKLRGGRRNPVPDAPGSKEDKPQRRSRSTSSRRKRSKSAGPTMEMKRSNSSEPRKRSNSKLRSRSKSKPRRSSKQFPDTSMSTLETKESKDSKKKKKKKDEKEKKKRIKDDSSDVSSIPSKVEMDNRSQDSSTKGKKKKTKDKEKKKDPKQTKPKLNYPSLPADEFGNGLEGLDEEFRRMKEKGGVPGAEGTNVFDSAWNDTESKQPDPVADEKDELLRQAVAEKAEQQEEILKLQQQLSTALQKQLTMSEDHINEKNEFMNVSRELERVKVELAEAREERTEVMVELKDRDRIIVEDKNKIESLEQAIDKQLEKEEELMKTVHHSEEEIENLLDEIQKFEKKLEDGGTSDGGGASFVELRNAKKDLAEREEEVSSQKLRIEELENELKDAMTVPQLQIEELDQENKALQGRLKGERLEYTSKLSAKDDVIQSLRAELSNFTSSPDAQDLQSALQKLSDARDDATTVRESLAAAMKKIEELQGEREDFLAEFNSMKDNNAFMEKTVKELNEKNDGLAKKVLEWTEKTYDWKQRAEAAEKMNGNEEKAESDLGKADPQGMFLQVAMDKGKSAGGRGGSWGIFKKSNPDSGELSAEETRIRVLEEQNLEYEAKIAQLSSDIVKMQTGHKEELYTTKKKIAQLEGENEALSLQNATLEQLRQD